MSLEILRAMCLSKEFKAYDNSTTNTGERYILVNTANQQNTLLSSTAAIGCWDFDAALETQLSPTYEVHGLHKHE